MARIKGHVVVRKPHPAPTSAPADMYARRRRRAVVGTIGVSAVTSLALWAAGSPWAIPALLPAIVVGGFWAMAVVLPRLKR